MGKKLYAVLMGDWGDDEYRIMNVTTNKEKAEEQAGLSEYRKLAVIGEMIEEGE